MFKIVPQFGDCAQSTTSRRFLGRTFGGSVLILMSGPGKTAVELYERDMPPKTVISFNKRMDIISADITHDREMVHLAERVESSGKYSFVSSVYDLNKFARSKVFKCNKPITGHFLPGEVMGRYHMLHFVGTDVNHVMVYMEKRNVMVKKYRSGIFLKSVSFFQFNREKNIFFVITSNNLIEYNFQNEGMLTGQPLIIPMSEKNILSDELALYPTMHEDLPFFSFSNSNFYIGKIHSRVCLIQQNFEGSESCCSFSILTLPLIFRRNIMVPGVSSNSRLCFCQFDSIIFVFVPDKFIYMIDIIQNPPNISMLPGECIKLSSNRISTLPIPNHFIDLESSVIYKMEIDFSQYDYLSKLMNRTVYDAFAQICSRTLNNNLFVSMLHIIEMLDNYQNALTFIRDFFRYSDAYRRLLRQKGSFLPKKSKSSFTIKNALSEIEENKSPDKRYPLEHLAYVLQMEADFPSASSVTRKRFYKHIIKTFREIKESKTIEEASLKAIQILKKQNTIVTFIRDSFDTWLKEFSPNEKWIYIFEFIIQSEAIFNNFPTIPNFPHDLEQLSHNHFPPSIYNLLMHNGLYTNTYSDSLTNRYFPSNSASSSSTFDSIDNLANAVLKYTKSYNRIGF